MINKYRNEFNIMCGGHGKTKPELIDDLLICAKGILDGRIKAVTTKIHIFDGMFTKYGNAHITYSTQRELLGYALD